MKTTIYWKSAILLLIAVSIFFLRLHGLKEPLERDLSTYAYIGHNILEGKELYTDLWDHKPPGIYMVYSLAELLWGYDQKAIVYMGIVFTLVSLLFLYGFLNRIADSLTALIGTGFFALASNSVTLQANQPNAELFMNTFTIMALWALSRWIDRKHIFLFFSGIFFAAASWFKMIAAFPVALICMYLLFPLPKEKNVSRWIRARAGYIALFISPAILLWNGTFIYFGIQGRFAGFWEAVFDFNKHYSGNILNNAWTFFTSPQLLFNVCLKEVYILVILSIAWFSINRKQYGSLKKPFFILLFFGLCLEVAAPGKHYPHYYQLLLPILVILPALFFYDLLDLVNRSQVKYGKHIVASLVVFSLAMLVNYQVAFLRMTPFEISEKKYGSLFTESYAVAQLVKEITEPCHKIYEWGAEPGIYYYSKRNSVTGIIEIYPLIWGPKKERLKKIQRVFNDVSRSRPEVFIFNEEYGKIENNFFSQLLQQHYELTKRMGTYLLFRSKDIKSCN